MPSRPLGSHSQWYLHQERAWVLMEGSEGTWNNQKPMLSGYCAVIGAVQWIFLVGVHFPTLQKQGKVMGLGLANGSEAHYSLFGSCRSWCIICSSAFLLPQGLAAMAVPITGVPERGWHRAAPQLTCKDMELERKIKWVVASHWDMEIAPRNSACMLSVRVILNDFSLRSAPLCNGNGSSHSGYHPAVCALIYRCWFWVRYTPKTSVSPSLNHE